MVRTMLNLLHRMRCTKTYSYIYGLRSGPEKLDELCGLFMPSSRFDLHAQWNLGLLGFNYPIASILKISSKPSIFDHPIGFFPTLPLMTSSLHLHGSTAFPILEAHPSWLVTSHRSKQAKVILISSVYYSSIEICPPFSRRPSPSFTLEHSQYPLFMKS